MKKIGKRFILLLTSCLTAASMLVPTSLAYAGESGAAQNAAKNGSELIVNADGDEKLVSIDDADLYIEADGSKIDINQDQVATANETCKITVPEDINVTGLSVANVFNGTPELSVIVKGNVTNTDQNDLAQSYALHSERDGDKPIDITVKGDVSSNGTGYEVISQAVYGYDTNENENGHPLQITVEGDVKATGTATKNSLQEVNGGPLYNKAQVHAIEVSNDVQVHVLGNVIATATGGTEGDEAIGIYAKSGANVTVEKNVQSNYKGIQVDTERTDASNPSLIIVKGDVNTSDAAVVINLDSDTGEGQLPNIVIGSIKDQNGNAVDKPEEKLVVSGSPSQDLTDKAMGRIYYIVDTSGVGRGVRVSGTKKVSGFDGDVASAGDQITISVGSSSVLEGVSAGAYATVTQVNQYTYVITVRQGGDLHLKGIWTPAVTEDDIKSETPEKGNKNKTPAKREKNKESSGNFRLSDLAGGVPNPILLTDVLPFTDVNPGDWFYEAVKYVYDKGIMDGITDTYFGADETLPGSEFATILYRMAGKPPVTAKQVFPDVPITAETQSFAGALTWAKENNLILGNEDGNFGPDEEMTREEIVEILYRYAKYCGYDTTKKGDLADFADAEDVGTEAKDAMEWAVGNEIINVHDGSRLDLQKAATRAECAAIVEQFMKAFAER